MEGKGKAEYVIQESGCGKFQMLMVLLVYVVPKVPTAYVMMFMSYGIYNPGWTCLDSNNISSYLNYSKVDYSENIVTNNSRTSYNTNGSCQLFKSCQRIEFDPRTSTIVSEWELLCDNSWIPSVIISIQMTGVLVGSLIIGQLGDSLGRKKVLYGAIAINGILNIISVFIQTWQFFAVLRFFMGVMLAGIFSLYYILTSEFLTTKWRGFLAPIPAWHLGGMLFGVTAMILKDWRQLHLIGGVLCIVCCLPAFWVPESLRWLEVKEKSQEFEKVVRKIASINKNDVLLEKYDGEGLVMQNKSTPETATNISVKRYTIFDIFRKGYMCVSVILAIIWMSSSLIYYAISFGVKSMYGDFYINLIILFAIEIPFSIFPIVTPNILGRKISSILFMGLTASCLLVATFFELYVSGEVLRVGTLILALLAKVSINSAWYIIITITSEVYPTAVRSIGVGYGNLMARFGGIIAPFLVPKSPDIIYVPYAIMCALAVVCCILMIKLPETKGKKLKETFDDNFHGDSN